MSLFKEIKSGNFLKVLEILQSNPDLSILDPKTGLSALHLAIQTQNFQILEAILDSPNFSHVDLIAENGETPLIYSINCNFTEGILLLLKHKAEPNLNMENLKSSVHFAAESNNLEIMRSLIAYKANINAVCKEGTPLHISIKEMNIEIAIFLLEQNTIELDEVDNNGNTSFHLSTIYGAGEICQKIIETLEESKEKNFVKEFVNKKNKMGNTILHETEINSRHSIRSLLENKKNILGLDYSIKNKEGKRSEDIKLEKEIKEKERKEILETKRKETIEKNRILNEEKKKKKIEDKIRLEKEAKAEKIMIEKATKESKEIQKTAPYFFLFLFCAVFCGMYIIFSTKKKSNSDVYLD